MTQVIVTDLGQTVVIKDSKTQTVVVEDSKTQTVVTGIMGPRGPRGASTFDEMSDVDLTQLSTGSLLVYNTQTQKWTATTLLDQQTVESGQF
jgi:hypothetical protein